MDSVTIDPALLVLPPITSGRDPINHYIDTLVDWSTLLREQWANVYASERSPQLIFSRDRYSFQKLKCLLRQCEIVEYDANTVDQMVIGLLQATPTFEDVFGIHDILSEGIVTDPDIVLDLAVDNDLREELVRLILATAIVNSLCGAGNQRHRIVESAGPDGLVRVEAVIHEVEHKRNDLQNLPLAPERFSGAAMTHRTLREFVKSIDEVALWADGDCEYSMRLAIRVAVMKSRISRFLLEEWRNVPDYSQGEQFFETATRFGRAGGMGLRSRILRSVVETLENLNMTDTHAIRSSRGGNAEQLSRGSDKAWRRDIDREYHLHYWECTEGRIELASVVNHRDTSIPTR